MRRRPGIQGLQRTQAARDQYKVLGDQVNQTKLELMQAQLATFKGSLEEFALHYRSDIRQDPVFRAQFHAMCANIGVDPLASNKGTWNKLLGFGDFYYELGVQVTETCLALRPLTGGFVELGQLHRYVQRRRGSAADPVSADDLLRAIHKLRSLGGGFGVAEVGGRQYVRSVPVELSTDDSTIVGLAQQLGGFFTKRDAAANTGWLEARLVEVLGRMARDGLLLIDDPPPGPGSARLYWVPAVGMEQATEQYRQQYGLAAVAQQPVAEDG